MERNLIITVFQIRDVLIKSGSADPCYWITDPDPAILFSDFQDANKKYPFLLRFFDYYLPKVHLHQSFSKGNKLLRSQKTEKKSGFSQFFSLLMDSDPYK